jgi:hypothetical protein
MRVARNKVELCGLCSDHERDIGDHPCQSTAAIETRFVLNRAETKALNAAWWLRELWFEQVVYRASRARCRVFGKHGVTCPGRADHRPRTAAAQ